MLERATACLKHRGKSTLAPPKRLARSRRSLHSAFWNHGAGDIDLPFWWIDFLQRPACHGNTIIEKLYSSARRYLPVVLNSGLWLEFLYPPKSVALAQRVTARESRHLAAPQTYKHAQRDQARGYAGDVQTREKSHEESEFLREESTHALDLESRTRLAQQEISRTAASEIHLLNQDVDKSRLYRDDSEFQSGVLKALEDFDLKRANESHPDDLLKENMLNLEVGAMDSYKNKHNDARSELARLSNDINGRAQFDHVRRTLRRVSHSGIQFAHEYLEFILRGVIPKNQRLWTENDFVKVIKATYLSNHGSLRERRGEYVFRGDHAALRYYKTALESGRGLLPTKALLELSLSSRDWTLAVHTLAIAQGFGVADSAFWGAVRDFDQEFLAESILAMETFFRRNPPCKTKKRPMRESISNFIADMIVCFLSRRISVSLSLSSLQTIWEIFERTGVPITNKHLQLRMEQLLSPSDALSVLKPYTLQALTIWRLIRQDTNLVWRQRPLEVLFSKLCYLHNRSAAVVFEHIQSLYGLYPYICHKLLAELAYHGHWMQFGQCLEQFRSKCDLGPPQKYIPRFIEAASRARDLSRVRDIFRSIRSNYGVEPDLSCWNAVIEAHCRNNDILGALEWYEMLIKGGLEPDHKTLLTMIRAYCSRGEVDAAHELLQGARDKGFPLNTSTIEALVYGYVQNGDVDSAERLLFETSTMDTPGPKTAMWNMVMNAFALQRRMSDVNYLHGRMLEMGIPDDSMTYAALMQSFASNGNPSLAIRLMTEVMPLHRIKPTIFHYNVLMSGCIRIGEYGRAVVAFKKLKKARLAPDFSSYAMLIRAIAGLTVKGENKKQSIINLESIALDKVEAFLEDFLTTTEPHINLTTHHPIVGSFQQPFNEAYAANFFDTLMLLYGQQGFLSKVSRLFDRYIQLNKARFPHNPDTPPIRILSALMVACLRDENHVGVQNCWQTAMEKAVPLARRAGADLAKPSWVLRSHRLILCQPLVPYLESLASNNRLNDIQPLLDSLRSSGFAFDSRVWNTYTQLLALHGQHLEAFRITETHLIAGFGGWPRLAGAGFSPGHALWRHRPRGSKEERCWPTYRTLVILARAYMDYRAMHAFSMRRNELLQELTRVAPATVDAITLMPRVDDADQSRYLRGRV